MRVATRWIVGIDEAGLGPNFGPLVVAASLWRADERVPLDDLAAAWRPLPGGGPRVWGDSKKLHSGPDGFRKLERALLAALATCTNGPPGSRLGDLWKVGCIPPPGAECEPWRAAAEEPFPAEGEPARADAAAASLAEDVEGARLCGVRAKVVFPQEFNEGIERTGNKAACLTQWSLELLRSVLDALPTHPGPSAVRVEAVCDRHGGRARYAEPLLEAFPGRQATILDETPTCSRYRLGEVKSATSSDAPNLGLGDAGNLQSVGKLGSAPVRRKQATLFETALPAASPVRPQGVAGAADGLPLDVSFHVGGERHLPTALASMLAKYLREREMRAWNAYWTKRLPGVRPTAGYPVDALRFRAEIASLVAEHEWFALWRNR